MNSGGLTGLSRVKLVEVTGFEPAMGLLRRFKRPDLSTKLRAHFRLLLQRKDQCFTLKLWGDYHAAYLCSTTELWTNIILINRLFRTSIPFSLAFFLMLLLLALE